jgi:hypothetical protein
LKSTSGPDGPQDFLSPSYLRSACEQIGAPPDIRDALLSVLPRFTEQPGLAALSRRLRSSLFSPSVNPPEKFEFPVIQGVPKNEEGLVHAITLLSGLGLTQEFYRCHAIPETVLKETLADMELWMRDYKARHNVWGLRTFNWLVRHFQGRLFQLGRLQFEMAPFPLDFQAFRRRKDGRVIVLCNSGMRFRQDGQFADADGRVETTTTWEASLTGDGEWIEGNPVSPFGRALREPVKLADSEWEPVLVKGDPILSVHIPAAGPMDFPACGEAFKRAVDFFPKHFPCFGARAFYCCSWLLDPQFEACLPRESNIVRFLSEFYLVPVPAANPNQMFERVFDATPSAPGLLPQKTSLQRAIAEKLKQGWLFRLGGMVAFPGDLRWGNTVYRRPGFPSRI